MVVIADRSLYRNDINYRRYTPVLCWISITCYRSNQHTNLPNVLKTENSLYVFLLTLLCLLSSYRMLPVLYVYNNRNNGNKVPRAIY